MTYAVCRSGEHWDVVLQSEDEFDPDIWQATCALPEVAQALVRGLANPVPATQSVEDVFVAAIRIDDEISEIGTFRELSDAREFVADFARRYFHSELGDEEDMPDDPDEVIEQYFDYVDGESYEIKRCTVE